MEKGHKRGRVLKRIKRKGGGFGKFCPFFFLLPTEAGEGAAALGAGGPGGLAALGKKGKTEREVRGIDSRPHLARRRPEGAGHEGRRRRAEASMAAALQGRGGGARGLGGFVEERRRKEGPIYNQAMAVERCGAGGQLASIEGRH